MLNEEELTFKTYKEKQAYYKEKYKNRGTVIHISKIERGDGKVLQPGTTYYSQNGEIRRFKRMAKNHK